MSQTSSSLIQLKNIEYRWNLSESATIATEDFQIFPREKIFIQGASGSGKTTLLGILGALLTPQQGEVHILNTALHHLSDSLKDAFRVAHIGFIFQMFNLLPYLSIIDNVILPCQFSKKRKITALQQSSSIEKEALRLLHALGIGQKLLEKTSVSELSVGQQQRVAVARAMIGSPEIIIADEPTSALDAERKIDFIDLLFRECSSVGATLIFVSHDPTLAPLFDRTVTMDTFSHSS